MSTFTSRADELTDLRTEVENLRNRQEVSEAKISELQTAVSLLMAAYQLQRKIEEQHANLLEKSAQK